MPPVMPDYQPKSAVARYAGLAWNGLAIPACGCFVGAVWHLLAGLWNGAKEWHTKSWTAARADWALAIDEFRKSAPK